MTHASELLDRAAGQLQAAANQADEIGQRDGSPGMFAFAGQIRLTAAGLSQDPLPAESRLATTSVSQRLHSALESLDQVDPSLGPPDLQLWASHVAELVRIADRTDET